ncbi:Probable leucine-rich repeat receptor-like protein kinase At2g33170, partial [Linum perenne]
RNFPILLLYILNLLYLDLRFNSFTGPIPNELFNHHQLEANFLNNNQFDGSIPQNLGSEFLPTSKFRRFRCRFRCGVGDYGGED